MRMVSVKIVSEFLMVKQSTVYSWVRTCSIPFHKLNGLIRFDMDEIESWVKTCRPSARPIPNMSLKRYDNRNINRIIKNAVDDVRGKEYNPSNGKPGQMQGLRKEE